MEIDFFLRKCLLSLEHDLTAQVNGCSWTVSFAFLINAECFFAVKKLFIFVLPVEEIKKVLFFTAIVIACTLTQCEWMRKKMFARNISMCWLFCGVLAMKKYSTLVDNFPTNLQFKGHAEIKCILTCTENGHNVVARTSLRIQMGE